jgi:septum formation protein
MQNSSNFLIYLASASPRRSALLAQIGVEHRVRPVDIDEGRLTGETPLHYVERLAALKAETLWARLEESERRPVLGSDTTVALDRRILAKPVDEMDAIGMLQLLSARTHQVYTAVALRHARGRDARVSVSQVSFRALTDEECRAYWRSGEPADKAGAYGIQGIAAVFIERIEGSYSGIMGLPLYETAELLGSIGWGIHLCGTHACRPPQAGAGPA